MTLLSRRATLHALVGSALAAADAPAQVVREAVNAEYAPAANTFWIAASVGWFYTPGTTYTLSGVETRFLPGSVPRLVTVELLTAPRADGGVLLRSATFNSSVATDTFGGGYFANISLVGGRTYFVGFRNVSAPAGQNSGRGLGINVTDAPSAARLAFRSDRDDSGAYAGVLTSPDPIEQRPILRFVGPAAQSVVPEPSACLLVGTGLLTLGGLVNRRCRTR
jgi:hypothetical protein